MVIVVGHEHGDMDVIYIYIYIYIYILDFVISASAIKEKVSEKVSFSQTTYTDIISQWTIIQGKWMLLHIICHQNQ